MGNINLVSWLRNRQKLKVNSQEISKALPPTIPGALGFWCMAPCFSSVLIPPGCEEICPACGHKVQHIGAAMKELEHRQNLDPTTTGKGTKPIRWHQKAIDQQKRTPVLARPFLTAQEVQGRAKLNMAGYLTGWKEWEEEKK